MPLIKWSQPNLIQAGTNLIKSEAKAILFKPIRWVIDNHETILDIKDAIAALQSQYPSVIYTD